MEIYIGKDGQVLGPYFPDEIQTRLDADLFDGTEKAWREGLESWVNVKELLEGVDEPAPETEESSVEIESTAEPAPLDEETLEQVGKIKELISDGHADTAWQLIQSLNNPRIYEKLLEECPVDGDGRVSVPESVPEYLKENADLFLKLLAKLPEDKLTQLTWLGLHSTEISAVTPLKELTQLTDLNLNDNEISDVSPLKELTQLTWLGLDYNEISDVTPLKELTQLTTLSLSNKISESDIEELKGALPDCVIHS